MWYERTRLLLSPEQVETLKSSRVAVIGLGGVGGAAAEGLCRSGIGHMLLIDADKIDQTNINRQLFATHSVIGRSKTEVAKARLLDINPDLDIECQNVFLNGNNMELLWAFSPNYVVDAIDTVSSKLPLIEVCVNKNVPVVTSLGAGNRLHPESLRLGDISDTAGCGCGLARVMRKELRRRGIDSLPVVYSKEFPKGVIASAEHGRHAPGSFALVPPVAGYFLASKVISDLLGEDIR